MNIKDSDVRPVRTRDPNRAGKILDAAARLFAVHGFHAVSLTDIGKEAGIVGSGVYRHFNSKVAVLLALLDEALDDVVESAESALQADLPPKATLSRLIKGQIDFCMDHRLAVRLYRTELTALDEQDSRRLRRIQRRYNDEWVDLLLTLRPHLDEVTARALVHATIGAIQSSATYYSGLDRDLESRILQSLAEQCLSTEVKGSFGSLAATTTLTS